MARAFGSSASLQLFEADVAPQPSASPRVYADICRSEPLYRVASAVYGIADVFVHASSAEEALEAHTLLVGRDGIAGQVTASRFVGTLPPDAIVYDRRDYGPRCGR